MLSAIRRELRRISPDVRIDCNQISEVLTSEVIKREVLEGEKAIEARRKIERMDKRSRAGKAPARSNGEGPSQPVAERQQA